MSNDLLILGGGPAGAAAGVYAARKRLNTTLITDEFGGQSTDSVDIQNWIGIPSISGDEFAKMFREHLKEYADDVLAITDNERVESIVQTNEGYQATTNKENTYEGRAILIATGSHRRKLRIPGAEEFDGRGVVYCASCDAPLFDGKDVVVVGGGNAGFEAASQLTEYASSITLLEQSDEFNADPLTIEKVLENETVTALKNAELTRIDGDAMVNSVTFKNNETEEETQMDVQGVFVEIGQIPNTGFVSENVETDEYGHIKIDCRTQQTSAPGIWAAGDCTDVLYHQNNIAAGDGVRALEDIYVNLKTK